MIGSITIGTDSRKNYRIPITEPVFYNKQELPIHPYLLGVLIGDGGMTGTCTILSSKDLEILNKVNELIAEYGLEINPTLSTVKGEHCDYLLHQKDRSITKTNYITAETGKLGIRCKSEYKFIPNIYLYSSIKDRVELLQGLMDIDGTVDKRSGCPSFSTSSPTLKDNFCELVRSLGGIATISIKKTKSLDNYVININMPNNINIFKLSRKQNLVISKTKYITSRFITNIEYIGQTEQQCILINSEDHLYLTDNHIVTHNTFCALATALNLLGEKYKRIVLIKSVTTIPDEAIGFLPGSAEEKVEPFMMSFT